MFDGFTYFAWFVLAVLFFVLVAIIVALGSLPGNIAAKRNHPQAAAINACSWIGLALMGVGWPIAFVWAFLNAGPVGFDPAADESPADDEPHGASDHEVSQMRKRIAELESEISNQQGNQD